MVMMIWLEDCDCSTYQGTPDLYTQLSDIYNCDKTDDVQSLLNEVYLLNI